MFRICIAFLLLFSTIAQAQQKATAESGKEVILYANGTWVYAASAAAGIVYAGKLEVPAVLPGEARVEHLGYTLSYSEQHEQASWVAYVLTREETLSAYKRTNSFFPDPLVTTGTAGDLDYKSSGYDRGHLAPAADMGWSATAMQESFYYSNMSPQLPGFNRGVWKRLEELVRYWAAAYDSVYVVTGPVLSDGLPVIGPNRVSVPQYYYKAILKHVEGRMDGVGFVLPHASSPAPLQSFAVSIDSVEALTGLDLFAALHDGPEAVVERTVHKEVWQWTRSGSPVTISGERSLVPATVGEGAGQHTVDKAPARRTASVQCTGATQAGARCRNRTLSPNGRCWRHGAN